ncbi:shikimate kinase [Aerosakkonemataceae cyanobacterium BLCC-F154]|uniref:Shikimate kinase n=1 Tax=Floridaenema fluviatile BLCC-F154 TaxID=3153640 RepID=A0ABV4YEG7_9CYAN
MDNILKDISVYLIGMMGAGKTTVGHLLAQELGYSRFFDTDTLIEQLAQGQTINEIFATAGEEAFRELETQVLAELCTYKRTVVSTGGGIVLRQKNWSYLQHGLVIWLDVPVELLIKRLQEDNSRPLLKDTDPEKKLQMLLEQRQPLYSQADLRITVQPQETPEQITKRILAEIPLVLKPPVVPPSDFN